MTRQELEQLVPIPFMDLLELPDPMTEMDLDTALPTLLDRAESLAALLYAAVMQDLVDVEKLDLLRTVDMLHEHLHAANVVFRAWNMRPGQGPGPRPTPPPPEAEDAPNA